MTEDTTATDTTKADERAEHVKRIRAAVDALNAATKAAAEAGISTSFGMSIFGTTTVGEGAERRIVPTHYTLNELRIDVPADWDNEDPGVRLWPEPHPREKRGGV